LRHEVRFLNLFLILVETRSDFPKMFDLAYCSLQTF
jgi:hypothetical protein